MSSVMSTALSRLNAFLDSELEQILCFDTAIDAEKFCSTKSAIFIVLPEEDTSKHFNPSQKLFYSVGYYEMEINNGGLCQFFVNSSRVVAPFLSEYLKNVGANEHKKLYDDFVSSNGIDLSDLSSFYSPTVEDFVAQTKRYPFDDFDDAYMELEPLETYLTKFAKDNISDF